MSEARLIETEGGLEPANEGWFVVNVDDACWWRNDAFGEVCEFESEAAPFPQLGINLHVLEPGQPNCMYHGENQQEDFLVLQGECLLLVEGEERRLRQWDFVHCPPWTEHVFVGAGESPCVILMVGSRQPDERFRYPVSELARSHGAGVDTETTQGREAYARYPRSRRARPTARGVPWRSAAGTT